MKTAGFSLLELLVVVAIVAIMASAAVPGTSRWLSNQRLTSSAQAVSRGLAHARGEAIKTGNVWIAFFGSDASGSSLSDSNGDTVPILLLDDGRPGDPGQNCRIDSGETIVALTMDRDAGFGLSFSNAKVPTDTGTGTLSSGSTFTNGAGGAASWVMFRPQGTPMAFNGACALGGVGSGGGGIYLTNGNRDMAVVVTPLGSSRVHRWASDGASWSD